jgi:hypothetical protein
MLSLENIRRKEANKMDSIEILRKQIDEDTKAVKDCKDKIKQLKKGIASKKRLLDNLSKVVKKEVKQDDTKME